MRHLRRLLSGILTIGFLIVATSSAGGLLWALVDTRHVTRVLGPNFGLVAIAEVAITLYALGKGITLLSDSREESYDRASHKSHSFRK